jgi:4-hydroxyphenylpyruvate dioxygenase-like putative hemolysin
VMDRTSEQTSVYVKRYPQGKVCYMVSGDEDFEEQARKALGPPACAMSCRMFRNNGLQRKCADRAYRRRTSRSFSEAPRSMMTVA